MGPVSAAGLTEVAWLGEVVIVVVAELGVVRIAAGAVKRLGLLRRRVAQAVLDSRRHRRSHLLVGRVKRHRERGRLEKGGRIWAQRGGEIFWK